MEKKQNQKRILVVDDNPYNVQLAGSVLRNEGYAVEFSTTAKDAIEWVLSEHFDLILLDVVMPIKNGFQLCSEIKSINGYKDVPVIFISSHTDPEVFTEGYRVGGVDYIMKPIVIEELKARVGLHIQYYETKSDLDAFQLSREKFLSVLSRDLLRPASALVLMLERLVGNIQHFSAEEINSMLVDLLQSSREKEAVLDSVLTWALFQYGRIKFAPVELLPSQVISEVLDTFRVLAVAKSIQLIFTKGSEKQVFTDRFMLYTILRNLISNALKYTGEGGAVKLDCFNEDGSMVFVVTDNGIGMTKEQLDSLFLPKESDIYGWRSEEASSGLGLIICKSFSDIMSGTLKYTSAPNKGTKVEFFVPLKA